MMQTPPIITPAHGCVVGVVVVVVAGLVVVVVGAAVVVVVAGLVVVVVGAAVVVVVAGFVVVVVGAAVVVVVVAGLVVVVVGAAVVVVAGRVVVVVGAAVVELTGDVLGSVDGTQSPKPASKKRRGLGATCAAKQTRSVGPVVIGCTPEGAQRSHGSPTRAERPLTVTGNGGVKCTEFREG